MDAKEEVEKLTKGCPGKMASSPRKHVKLGEAKKRKSQSRQHIFAPGPLLAGDLDEAS
jgi:hypothetical protein